MKGEFKTLQDICQNQNNALRDLIIERLLLVYFLRFVVPLFLVPLFLIASHPIAQPSTDQTTEQLNSTEL